MSKTTTPKHSGGENPVTHLDFLKKFKRFSPLESSLAVLLFFFVASLFIACLFYFDYRKFRSRGTNTILEFDFSSSSVTSASALVQFLSQDGDKCDVFDGNWVWDDTYPLYDSENCFFFGSRFSLL